MELYERVKQLSKQVVGSESKLASVLGLRQNKFNAYLNAVSQRNLWEHLPAILAAFPQVRRDWLYFGEGSMLKDSDGLRVAVPPMTTAVPPLQAACVGENAARAADDENVHTKLMAAYELNARLSDEVLRLNEERRTLVERLEWEKGQDKIVLSPTVVLGELPGED